MSKNNRQVTYLKLVNGIFVPGQGMGQLGDTFPSSSKSNAKDVKMFYSPDELTVTLVSGARELVVPITNVSVMSLAPKENNA